MGVPPSYSRSTTPFRRSKYIPAQTTSRQQKDNLNYIYFCVCLLCLQRKRGEGKKSEAFDLGYTTLILNASQQKKNKSQA